MNTEVENNENNENNVSKDFFNKDGGLIFTAVYNQSGQEIQRKMFDDKGKNNGVVDYVYGDNGDYSYTRQMFYEDGQVESVFKREMDGTSKQTAYHSNGVMSFDAAYDDDGHPIHEASYSSNGALYLTSDYTYDQTGKQAGLLNQYYENGEIDRTEKTKFAENGNYLQTQYDKDGTLLGTTEMILGDNEANLYYRDNQGNLTSRRVEHRDGSVENFSYDKNGAIIDKNVQSSDDEKETVTESMHDAEPADTKKKRKGDREDETELFKQSANLRQWLRYYELDGAMAVPPYASPFMKVKSCKTNEKYGGVEMQLDNDNRIINNDHRIDLVRQFKRGEKTPPTLEECMTLVRLGQKKGWTSARLTGSPEFQKQMYLACRAMGMPVKDYIPSADLIKEAAGLEELHQNSTPSLSDRCTDLDARFPRLEKMRKAQPKRESTLEDPYPDMADFKLMRKAAAQGLAPFGITSQRPLNETVSEPAENQNNTNNQDDTNTAQLHSSIVNANKEVAKALTKLRLAEVKALAKLESEAIKVQRDVWRSGLVGIEAKEAQGTALTADEEALKKIAEKYKVMTDIAKEPKVLKPIERFHLDASISDDLGKKEKNVEVQTVLAASIMRRQSAQEVSKLILDPSAKIKTESELIASAQSEVRTASARDSSISALLQEAGRNKSTEKEINEKNAEKYNALTGKSIPTITGLSKSAKVLDVRVAALMTNSR